MDPRRLGTGVSNQALISYIQWEAGDDERIPERRGVAAERSRVRSLAQKIGHRELGMVSQQFLGLDAGFRIPSDFGVARDQRHLGLGVRGALMAVGFDRFGSTAARKSLFTSSR